jgi:hypothetical protein
MICVRSAARDLRAMRGEQHLTGRFHAEADVREGGKIRLHALMPTLPVP